MQNGHPVPGVAQAAIQQGRYVGRLICERLKGREPGRPFRYFDKGNMAVVGQELCDPGGRSFSHERIPGLADMGIHSRVLASPAAESIAGRNPMALDVPHRSAQLAPDFRAAEDGVYLQGETLAAEPPSIAGAAAASQLISPTIDSVLAGTSSAAPASR
jgi:hypothetical protein